MVVVIGKFMPDSDAAAIRSLKRCHAQTTTIVRENEGPCLIAMPIHALVNIALYVQHLFFRQSARIKSTQVFPIGLARIDLPMMLGKKPCECRIPKNSAVF